MPRLVLFFFLMMLFFWPLLRWSATNRLKKEARKEAWEKVILAAEHPEKAHIPASVLEGKGRQEPVNARELPARPLIFPVEGKGPDAIISHYGDVRSGGKRTHEGIDIRAERGTPVLAVTDGVCRKVDEGGNAGRRIWLEGRDGRVYFYAHLDRHLVEEGQEVNAGTPIATVGNTGNARHTIPHLHFEVLGYGGEASDPLPFFVFP